MSYRDELSALEQRQHKKATRRNAARKWFVRLMWAAFAASWVVLAYKTYELLAFFHSTN